jgi:predicted metal-binding protein
MSQEVVLVCTLCGTTPQSRSQGCKGGGERLLEQLQAEDLPDSVEVHPVRCMAVCGSACAIALMGQGKRTYLFGKLPVEPDQLAATSQAVTACVRQYHRHSEGIVEYRDRPELLRSRTLVVLPALTS